MLFSARYHFIPFEWLSRRSEPRNSTRSKPDITPWISFSNLAINCCMAFLLWSSVADLDIQQRIPSEERQVFVCGLPLCGAGWQQLATCGGLVTRLPAFANGRPAPVASSCSLHVAACKNARASRYRNLRNLPIILICPERSIVFRSSPQLPLFR